MEQERYELEPMQLASGGWAVPCPKCQRLVEAATQEGVVEATCDHMNREHPARYFDDPFQGRDS